MQTQATQPAAHPRPQTVDKIVMTAAGEKISLYPSIDGQHVFLQIETDVDNSLVAIPAGALPWVRWAFDRVTA